MKYINNEIEWTHGKELFKGNFPITNTLYCEVNRDLINGLINYGTVIYGTLIINDNVIWDEILEDSDFIRIGLQKNGPDYELLSGNASLNNEQGTNEYWEYVKYNTKEKWFKAWTTPGINFHTKLAVVSDELLLIKVDDLEDTYVIFWYTQGRANYILKFETKDTKDVIIKEIKEWINGINEYRQMEVPLHAYAGWLSA